MELDDALLRRVTAVTPDLAATVERLLQEELARSQAERAAGLKAFDEFWAGRDDWADEWSRV